MNAPIISFENVSFWYNRSKKIIEQFSWRLQAGDSWAILGPSGCGKTTLLHLMAGIRHPVSGTVSFEGQIISKPHQQIGLMLQDYGLLPWYSAERNIQLGLQIRHLPPDEVQQRTNEWLEKLEISHIRQQYPRQLSGGQRQRVALARVLALQAKLLLLDEPLSAVDELTREHLQKRLWQLNRATGATTVMVTHNIEEAVLLANQIMIITDYAPICAYQVLTSPFSKNMPKRYDPEFIAFCQQIRKMVGIASDQD